MSAFEPTPEFFERIPTAPGVYLMKDRADKIVYVGKAKNLRTRVRQYFRRGGDARFFVAGGLLGRVLHVVDTIVVDNEKEALLLENHLIKQHQPRFNVNLRDDKQYLVLRIDPTARFPRVEVVRNIKDDSARYFGPYHSATSCRSTLRTLNRHFQLRTCTDHVLATRTRPCLQYQIQRCPAPCVHPVAAGVYGEQVDDVMMFLGGKNHELLARLRSRMHDKAAREQYEAAAAIRDSIAAIERTVSRQSVVQDSFVDQDVFGMARNADVVELVVLFVRGGKMVGRRTWRQREQEFPDGQVVASFVQQYYATGTFVPEEVLVPVELDQRIMIADWLAARRGRKVKILAPQRGQRRRLVALANKNAASSAVSRSGRDEDAIAGLKKLQKRLALRHFPHRIECYDIAHIQGSSTVASMVVFVDGIPDRTLYRTFKIKSVTNDDFASMYEVLSRRFKRALSGNAGDSWRMPNLLVVDGGKGQLGTAVAALEDLGVELTGERGFDVISLAKEREAASGDTRPDRVYRRNLKDGLELRPNTIELYVLARIRDEAHRFANTFHRQQRKRTTLRSILDDIPGIGEKRRKQLLRQFGSVKAIKVATREELAAVPGMGKAAAEAVRRHFDGGGGA